MGSIFARTETTTAKDAGAEEEHGQDLRTCYEWCEYFGLQKARPWVEGSTENYGPEFRTRRVTMETFVANIQECSWECPWENVVDPKRIQEWNGANDRRARRQWAEPSLVP